MSGVDEAKAVEGVVRKARESAVTIEKFFAENATRIVSCASAMSDAFDRGARLYVFGNGGSACDAQHMAVEFMHPVIEKRATFPAVDLSANSASMSAIGNDQDFALAFSQPLRAYGRAGDIALGLSTSGRSANVLRALQAARELSMLTIGFAGRDGGKMPALCDHVFVVPSYSIHRIQEVHATLVHILWDTLQVMRGEEDVL